MKYIIFITCMLSLICHPSFLLAEPWGFERQEHYDVQGDGKRVGYGELISLALLKIYSNVISPVDGDRCRMYPTCGAYSAQAVLKHGVFIGFIMTADRLIHESNEMDLAPLIFLGDEARYFDPLTNNDFWWFSEKGRVDK